MSHPSPEAVARFLPGPEPLPRMESFGADVPKALCDLVASCLQKQPSHRFPDAVSLLNLLAKEKARAQRLNNQLGGVMEELK